MPAFWFSVKRKKKRIVRNKYVFFSMQIISMLLDFFTKLMKISFFVSIFQLFSGKLPNSWKKTYRTCRFLSSGKSHRSSTSFVRSSPQYRLSLLMNLARGVPWIVLFFLLDVVGCRLSEHRRARELCSLIRRRGSVRWATDNRGRNKRGLRWALCEVERCFHTVQ